MRHCRSFFRSVLVLILSAAFLVACAGAGAAPTAEPVTITFACMDHDREGYERLVEGFQAANPDVRVQLVSASEISGMLREGNTVTSSGNELERLAAGADTFVWWVRLLPSDFSYLLDLQPFVDDTPSFPTEDYYPGTLDAFRWQKELYGLPAEVLPVLIFYDKGIFDEAGVAYPEAGWTWGDLLRRAADLTQRTGDEVSRYGFVDSHYSSTILAMMHHHGVPLWDEDADPPRPLFDRPEVANVLRSYMELAWTYEVMPVPEVGSNVMAFNLVNSGQAAMWTAFAFDVDYQAHRIDLGVAPFPEGSAAANPRYMYGFFASAGTAHPEAAWRWLTYLSGNHQPMEGILPGRRSLGEDMRWWRRLDRDTRAVLEEALAHPAPPINPLNLPLQRAMGAVIKGQSSVEEALEAAQSQALEMQAELAAATPVVPRPVSPPTTAPVEAETVIVFALDTSRDVDTYRALAAVFGESHPDIHVQVVQGPIGLAERAAGSDCFASLYPVSSPEVQRHILSLGPILAESGGLDLDDYYDAPLEAVQYDGQLWGIPYEADALMVYYSPERFAEAGVALPAPGWTVDHFLRAAVALTGGGRHGFTTREGAYGDLIFVLERMGAHLVDESGERPAPTFDGPTVVSALTRYVVLSQGQRLTPATPSTQSGWPDSVVWGTHPAGVATGEVAMWVDAVGNQSVAPPLPFEVAVAPLPVGSRASTEFSVRATYVSAHSAAPQACWEWLTFLSDRPEVVRWLPARRSIAASSDWQSEVDESLRAAYQATLAYEDASILRLRWEIRWLGYAYPWLDEAFQDALAGDDAEQALAEAQRKAEAYVSCLEREDGFADGDVLKACAREVDPGYPSDGS